uniref:Uncharacterized protein n=1 Tax=Sus scrofa TaxID=9823 RepID=A0A8D0YHN6_PIG
RVPSCSCWPTTPVFLHPAKGLEGSQAARREARRLIVMRSGRAADSGIMGNDESHVSGSSHDGTSMLMCEVSGAWLRTRHCHCSSLSHCCGAGARAEQPPGLRPKCTNEAKHANCTLSFNKRHSQSAQVHTRSSQTHNGNSKNTQKWSSWLIGLSFKNSRLVGAQPPSYLSASSQRAEGRQRKRNQKGAGEETGGAGAAIRAPILRPLPELISYSRGGLGSIPGPGTSTCHRFLNVGFIHQLMDWAVSILASRKCRQMRVSAANTAIKSHIPMNRGFQVTCPGRMTLWNSESNEGQALVTAGPLAEPQQRRIQAASATYTSVALKRIGKAIALPKPTPQAEQDNRRRMEEANGRYLSEKKKRQKRIEPVP